MVERADYPDRAGTPNPAELPESHGAVIARYAEKRPADDPNPRTAHPPMVHMLRALQPQRATADPVAAASELSSEEAALFSRAVVGPHG